MSICYECMFYAEVFLEEKGATSVARTRKCLVFDFGDESCLDRVAKCNQFSSKEVEEDYEEEV